jgi:hypothetical protein
MLLLVGVVGRCGAAAHTRQLSHRELPTPAALTKVESPNESLTRTQNPPKPPGDAYKRLLPSNIKRLEIPLPIYAIFIYKYLKKKNRKKKPTNYIIYQISLTTACSTRSL